MKTNIFKKIIHMPYYYVPPCPICGSAVTGHYVKQHRETEVEWAIDEGLRNGEIIDVKTEPSTLNAFCVECGHEWYDFIEMKLFSLERIEEEKRKRHIATLKKNRKAHKEAEEAAANKGFFDKHNPVSAYKRYMGKL